MSNMIMCNHCKKLMYSDSRSEKGAYHDVWIDRTDQFHLCRDCYNNMMRDTFNLHWNEDDYCWEDNDNDNDNL